MNKLIKGKKSLITISIVLMLLSLLLVGGSVGLIVYGANVVSEKVLTGIILIVVGSLLAILFLGGIIFSFVLYFTGRSLVALNGSVAEENLAKGTVNMIKCGNCGAEVEKNDKFCPKCGTTTEQTKTCEKCGTVNKVDSKVCTECGTKL